MTKFPKPWTMRETGHAEFLVVDANDCKLFYIVGDEGDGSKEGDEDYILPSALFYSEDTDFLTDEIVDMLGRVS